MQKNTLHKSERVRNKKVIDALFTNAGKSLVAYSFRFSWVQVENTSEPCSVLFISPKKKLKTAVERNHRKRLLREFYRLNKSKLVETLTSQNKSIALSLNYIGAETLNFTSHQSLFIKALNKLILELQKNHTSTLPPAH